MKIADINALVPESSKNPFAKKHNESYPSFSAFLKDAIIDVNRYQLESRELDSLFAAGEIDNIHEIMIAAGKADIALQLTIEVKNKIMDTYKEIMRLQL